MRRYAEPSKPNGAARSRRERSIGRLCGPIAVADGRHSWGDSTRLTRGEPRHDRIRLHQRVRACGHPNPRVATAVRSNRYGHQLARAPPHTPRRVAGGRRGCHPIGRASQPYGGARMTHDSELDDLERLATPEMTTSGYFKAPGARKKAVQRWRAMGEKGSASIYRLLHHKNNRRIPPVTLPKVSQ